jgi:hypothetical protein
MDPEGLSSSGGIGECHATAVFRTYLSGQAAPTLRRASRGAELVFISTMGERHALVANDLNSTALSNSANGTALDVRELRERRRQRSGGSYGAPLLAKTAVPRATIKVRDAVCRGSCWQRWCQKAKLSGVGGWRTTPAGFFRSVSARH